MYDYFKSYNSINNYKYNLSDGTLKYIYKSGSGFDFQYVEGLKLTKEYINQKYKNNKNYVELSIFFTLTGNSVNKMTCTEINKSSEYTNFATKYNNSIKEIINLGYKKTKGYVISHSPLNSKEAVNKFADKNKNWKIVYSTKAEACYSGYRSARKYWYSNKKMESFIATRKYANLTFIDNYSNFVIPNDTEAKHYTWLKDYYKTTDGLDWDEKTTKSYMQLAFDTAGM